MIPLILTVLCSTSIALILKINSSCKGDSILLLTGNYFSASVISLFLFAMDTSSTVSLDLVPLGLFLSILFVGSIFAFAKSVELSGAALSTVSSRLSVFVPIILSIIFYSDLPNYFQILGLILTFATIILFYLSLNGTGVGNKNNKKFFYLVSVLIGIGIADFFMKVFQENFETSDKPWFLFWIFFFSFLITLTLAIKERKKYENRTIILGLIMGIPNIFSSFFLIESLKTFNAVLVYPVVNISIIVLTALIVKIFWKEIWNIYSITALISGILSIILLSL